MRTPLVLVSIFVSTTGKPTSLSAQKILSLSERLNHSFLGDVERNGGGQEFFAQHGQLGGAWMLIPRGLRDEAQKVEQAGKEKSKPAP